MMFYAISPQRSTYHDQVLANLKRGRTVGFSVHKMNLRFWKSQKQTREKGRRDGDKGTRTRRRENGDKGLIRRDNESHRGANNLRRQHLLSIIKAAATATLNSHLWWTWSFPRVVDWIFVFLISQIMYGLDYRRQRVVFGTFEAGGGKLEITKDSGLYFGYLP